jgi:hypothetical protein
MVRGPIPSTSAASSHFIFPAIAFRITSCTFMARSTAAIG